MNKIGNVMVGCPNTMKKINKLPCSCAVKFKCGIVLNHAILKDAYEYTK